MKQTIRKVFRTPKFLTGFVIMVLILVTMVVYPLVISVDPLEMVGQSSFMPPGTYINVQDSVNSADYLLQLDVKSSQMCIRDRSNSDSTSLKLFFAASPIFTIS